MSRQHLQLQEVYLDFYASFSEPDTLIFPSRGVFYFPFPECKDQKVEERFVAIIEEKMLPQVLDRVLPYEKYMSA